MLKDRATYDTFARLGTLDNFSPLGRLVGGAIAEYYDVDSDIRSCSLEFIEGRMLGRIANPKHEAPLREYLRSLPTDVSAVNVEREIKTLYRRSVGGKLSLALANGSPQEEIDKLHAEYGSADRPGSGTSKRDSGALIDVLDTGDLTSGEGSLGDYIRLWPKALSDRLKRGALRGHHVLVYGRPEMGKTAVAVNLCAGFLHQELFVLYVSNEEPVSDVRERIRARLLKTTRDVIQADPQAAAERLARAKLGRLVIAGDAPTFGDVRRILRVAPADVVVFDQLRNMRVQADSKNAQLEAAANEARSIAKDAKALVVSITQAGDSATGKVFLDMSDVDNSKTGIPGAVDLMIGVGADDAMKLNGLIGFSLPKNKLGGIHDKFTASVNFATGVLE